MILEYTPNLKILDNNKKRFMQFIVPNWTDLMTKEMLNTTIEQEDSVTEIHDLRYIKDLVVEPSFEKFEWMWGTPFDDCSQLKWFIDKRDELIYCNFDELMQNTVITVTELLKRHDREGLIKANMYKEYLNDVVTSGFKGLGNMERFKDYIDMVNSMDMTTKFCELRAKIASDLEFVVGLSTNVFSTNEDDIKAVEEHIWSIIKNKI